LGFRQSKLMAEEEGFRRVTVGRRDIQRLHGIHERLGLLHKAGEIEHGSWYLLRWAAVSFLVVRGAEFEMSSRRMPTHAAA
jgi:hypothetical protein